MIKQRAERLTFSRTLFNPNFYHIVAEMKNEARRFIFPYGGSSSAKSYSTAQAILVYCCLIEGSDTLVFRKVSNTIKKTIKKDFETIIKRLSLDSYFEVQDFKIICYNGSVIDFSGIDDPEKIKGISSYKRVFMEELSEFELADFKQVRKRLRGMPGQQIIGAFNPIDVDHWIKTNVFDKETKTLMPSFLNETQTSAIGFPKLLQPNSTLTEKWEGASIVVDGVTYPPNFVVLKSTYKDNFWVSGSPCGTFGFYDIQTIADFEKDRLEDYQFFDIYANGNWGKLNRGGEAYKKFDNARHVKECNYDAEKSLHLTFDENVNPYLTLNIHQLYSEEQTARQIDEICLVDPRNTLNETLREFKNRYPNNGNTVYIYGDATSKKADAKLEKGKNFYVLIENYLSTAGYTFLRRVPPSNPNVEVRLNWLNRIFSGAEQINIEIDPGCIKTVSDYNYLKQASDGTKHKEKTRDPITKVSYEKYGHNTDANDYFYTYVFEQSFNQFRRPQGTAVHRVAKRTRKKGY
jgi:phage terminase large subunit